MNPGRRPEEGCLRRGWRHVSIMLIFISMISILYLVLHHYPVNSCTILLYVDKESWMGAWGGVPQKGIMSYNYNVNWWEKLKNDHNLLTFHPTTLNKSPKFPYFPWETIAKAKNWRKMLKNGRNWKMTKTYLFSPYNAHLKPIISVFAPENP